MSLLSNLESILFVASKPLSVKQLAKSLQTEEGKIEEAVETLSVKYNHDESGIHILLNDATVQMGTNPNNHEAVEGFISYEISSELTKAQLETLTIIAYCSPVTKAVLEDIRGVNCAVILRNLLMRGLIVEEETPDSVLPVYQLSVAALAHLGIQSVEELPEYDSLHDHEHLRQDGSEAQEHTSDE